MLYFDKVSFVYGPPDSAYALWYYPEINRFTDSDGNILHDLHELFDVWQLEEWKRTKDYGILVDHNGNVCELYYPSLEEEMEFILSDPTLKGE